MRRMIVDTLRRIAGTSHLIREVAELRSEVARMGHAGAECPSPKMLNPLSLL